MHSRPSASKGSGLEIIIPDDTNVGQFIPAWVRAAGDAQGTCTKVCADLEGLECQNELINMINDSSTGIAKARKGLTAELGEHADHQRCEVGSPGGVVTDLLFVSVHGARDSFL